MNCTTQRHPIAVGTTLSGGPPHRSQRAALPRWAPASGDGIESHPREGMMHSGRREPLGRDAVHPTVETIGLATTTERPESEPCQLARKAATVSLLLGTT